MTITPETTLDDLAFIVGSQLDRAGITAVLSGGGAATIYAPEAYQSNDLDFILAYWSSLGVSSKPLLDLGFFEENGSYKHPVSPFMVEFPKGPLAVGDEEITEWDTLRRGDLLLHILSPTDCVRDRLAWFIHGNDFSGLSQAVGVALYKPVDLEKVEAWCVKENAEQKFLIFRENLLNRTRAKSVQNQ